MPINSYFKSYTFKLATSALASVTLWATPVQAAFLPDYHVGNSLTVDAEVRPASEPGMNDILKTVGITRTAGWQLASGTGLYRHSTFTSNTGGVLAPATNATYGPWDNAFNNFAFHAITLQPWKDGASASQEATGLVSLIKAARAGTLNKQTKIFLYTGLPGTPGAEYPVTSTTTVGEVWNAPLPANIATNGAWPRSKAGVDWIREQAKLGTGETLNLVPLGDVLAALDTRLRANPVAGFDSVWDLYRDSIHLNFTGTYVAALTMATALYDIDPRTTGLTTGPNAGRYRNIDPAFAAVVQDVVYQTVTVPEPATLGLLGLGVLGLLARQR